MFFENDEWRNYKFLTCHLTCAPSRIPTQKWRLSGPETKTICIAAFLHRRPTRSDLRAENLLESNGTSIVLYCNVVIQNITEYSNNIVHGIVSSVLQVVVTGYHEVYRALTVLWPKIILVCPKGYMTMDPAHKFLYALARPLATHQTLYHVLLSKPPSHFSNYSTVR